MMGHMRRHILWIGLALALLFVAFPAQALAHGPSDGGANRSDIDGLFQIIGVMAMVVFLFVEGLILYAIWTRRKGADNPDQIEGNHALEIFWTAVSFGIIAVIFIFTYRFMTTEYTAEAQNETGIPDYTVHVTGRMFDWDYEYFDGEEEPTGVQKTYTLTLPTDRLILLEITSQDVQHSFWVPELAGKVDAVPGYTNTMWLNIDQPGTYKGNCAEFCGTGHANMLIELNALEPAEFEMWLEEEERKAGEMKPMGTDMESEMPEGDATRGEQLFTDLSCANCHGAQSGAGPSLPQIREDMHDHEGYTAEEYLRESILKPCAYETESYNCSMMPSNFGEKLDMQGLADIIEYILANGEK
jgi:cytochrome c oxidase subunit 2